MYLSIRGSRVVVGQVALIFEHLEVRPVENGAAKIKMCTQEFHQKRFFLSKSIKIAQCVLLVWPKNDLLWKVTQVINNFKSNPSCPLNPEGPYHGILKNPHGLSRRLLRI